MRLEPIESVFKKGADVTGVISNGRMVFSKNGLTSFHGYGTV